MTRLGRRWSSGIKHPQRRGHDRRRRQVHRPTTTPTRASTRRSTTAASSTGVKVNVNWVEAEALEQDGGDSAARRRARHPRARRLRRSRHARHDQAAQFARERGIPFFGICYGLQWATIEFARNVCGLADADSTEFAPDTPHPVIYKLRDLLGVDDLGGTMRLGRYACQLDAGLAVAAALRRRRDPRAAPPPLRVQQPLRADADRARACDRRAARPTASSSRSSSCRPPVVRRGAVPPRVQVEAARPHPLFAGFVEASLPPQDRARRAADASRRTGAAERYESAREHRPGRDRTARRSAAAGSAALHRRARASSRARRTRSTSAARSRRSPRAVGVPVRLQGVVRQGQPHLDRARSRPRPRRGPADARAGQGRARLSDPHRHPRAGAGRRRRRGRRRAADSRVPLPADRPAGRRRRAPARSSTSRRASSWRPLDMRHADRQGPRRGQRPRLRHRARRHASATTTSSSTCARSR